MIDVELLDPADRTWSAHIDRIGALLGVPNNPSVFPYHFLQVVLPRLGGTIAVVRQEGRIVGVAFLFPRCAHAITRDAAAGRAYTVRYHAVETQHQPGNFLPLLAQQLGSAQLTLYDPTQPQHYEPTHQVIDGVDIGRPNAEEAATVRALHQQIWGSPPEFLYPTDVHSCAFGAGTSLVARVTGADGSAQLAGFLLGFHKFDGSVLPDDWQSRFGGDVRLESQIMGVLPEYRGMRIAYFLKRIQASQAAKSGIGLVTWTADPLQYPNAALNFGLLRAVAFDFYPDLYPFRNSLNRVPASRFGITWLVRSDRVRSVPLTGSQALILDLRRHVRVAVVNTGWTDVDYTVHSALIAIEIPANWTELQERDIRAAMAWREVSDRIFRRYIGKDPGKYVITGVGTRGERRYLLGERVDAELWQQLGRE